MDEFDLFDGEGWTFFEMPSPIDDDNQLLKTTHRCPRTGDYCYPDCAMALINPEEEGIWVCGEAMKCSKDDYMPQGVKWACS
ncbi:MAG TPA: hypothetical protein DCW90_09640 [Lachnospiraceae bacterium]|nr:hypothetical protein [Lachnospiraceae bacterium]